MPRKTVLVFSSSDMFRTKACAHLAITLFRKMNDQLYFLSSGVLNNIYGAPDAYINDTTSCLLNLWTGQARALDADILMLKDRPIEETLPFFRTRAEFLSDPTSSDLFRFVEESQYEVIFSSWLFPWPKALPSPNARKLFFCPTENYMATSVHQNIAQEMMNTSGYCPTLFSIYGVGPGAPPQTNSRIWPLNWFEARRLRAMFGVDQPHLRSVHVEQRSPNHMRASPFDQASFEKRMSSRGFTVSTFSGKWSDWMKNLARQKYIFCPSSWISPGQVSCCIINHGTRK